MQEVQVRAVAAVACGIVLNRIELNYKTNCFEYKRRRRRKSMMMESIYKEKKKSWSFINRKIQVNEDKLTGLSLSYDPRPRRVF